MILVSLTRVLNLIYHLAAEKANSDSTGFGGIVFSASNKFKTLQILMLLSWMTLDHHLNAWINLLRFPGTADDCLGYLNAMK